MHLTRIRFGGVPPFTDPVELVFDERVNLFVGPNASGKSRLLSEIDEYFNDKDAKRHMLLDPGLDHLRLVFAEERERTDDWLEGKNILLADSEYSNAYLGIGVNKTPRPPVVYIGPTRTGLPGVSEFGEPDSYGSTVEEVLSGPFCGASLKAAIDLLYAKTLGMYDQEKQEEPPTGERRAWNFIYVDQVAHSCTKAICDELITSNRALNYPTGFDIEFLADQPLADLEGVSINRMLGISTTDTPRFEHIRPEERPINLGRDGSQRIYVGDLSSGSQSTLLWILWLALKMLNHYEFANGWNERPAVLLIDEIENHLHPTWQRRVIPALREHFPALQIFAATHSPFVVAGLRAGQVHMLKRDEDGVVTASTNERDIIGWTTDEILRTFMGVDEPTDQLTVNRANRLRELRGKETLSDGEGEEMAELRRQVNEDFISSSTPLEEQRERYGDMMLEFLRSRQSKLSQDGS
ncbi:MAG: AAA family ATPase [Chloroflexota bacterium]|nr:AAA family ATPase [Chloroflexota bacterium]